MKAQSAALTQSTASTLLAKPARLDDATRCGHRTPSGRRCKLPIHRPGERLCINHQIEYKKADAFNLQAALLNDSHAFQTAQGINNALQTLYGLLANNYISARRASVLAYISSLLLRTLPAIDAEQATLEAEDVEDPETEDSGTQEAQPATGTFGPDASEVTPSAESSELTEADEASATDPASTEPGESATKPTDTAQAGTSGEAGSRNETKPISTATNSKPALTKTKVEPDVWPEGLPEPDPTKKPS